MNKLSKLILMLPLALAPLAGQAAPKGGSHAALLQISRNQIRRRREEMTKEEKLVVINAIAEQLQAYPHFYIADIAALDAEQTAALRRKCFENDVKLVVVKNTLLGKALEKVEKADADLVKVLEGPTSIMFANVAKAPAVLIKEFRKKSDKPVLKAAFAEGCVYVGDDQLDALCNIKSKEELIGDIIALLQSPAKNVISALQANAGQKIAGIVKTLESRNN